LIEQPSSAVETETTAAAVKAAANPLSAVNALAVKATVPRSAPT